MALLAAGALAAGALAVAASGSSETQEPGWIAVKVAGKAEYRQAGGEWRELAPGTATGVEVELRTATGGRAVLALGADDINLASASLVALSAGPGETAPARAFQSQGTVQYRVARRPLRAFVVETPHLVAEAMGSLFTIRVDERGTLVSVRDGLVAVATPSRELAKVTPGMTARLGAGPAALLRVEDGAGASAPTGPRRGIWRWLFEGDG